MVNLARMFRSDLHGAPGSRFASPRVRAVLLVASGLGYVLGFWTLLEHGILTRGGAGAIDVLAYWTAGRNLLDGGSVYGIPEGGFNAYVYPPVFAQLVAPMSALPVEVFVWAWRALELACLRVTVGSWRNAGLAILFWPPVIAEIDAGNVHLIVAAAVAMAIRGDARALVPAALTKFASLAAVPSALRFDRRGLLIGVGAGLAASAVSFALTPHLWFDYVSFITRATEPVSSGFDVGSFIWTPLRLAIAAGFALAAVSRPRLSAVAVTLAYPVLWLNGLSTLTALVARPGGGRSRTANPEPR
ncbi:MAG: glycosyltransferase 87 family protein [Candidatus Limnocylindrales bacterium]